MSDERTCVMCGAEYKYCPNCSKYDYLPRWMYLFHDQNCYDIYTALNEYGAKHISKDEAIARLKKLDTSQVKGRFKEQVDKLLSSPIPKVEEVVETRRKNKNKFRKIDSDQDYTMKEDTI